VTRLAAIGQALVTCTICPAGPGKPCTTHSGARATRPHQNRLRAAEEAWTVGWTEGIQSALTVAEHILDPDKAHGDIWGDIERVAQTLRRWIA
jgi:hypothetical protein